MSPRLSVVIPVKDCLPYLPKAIDSIRRQGIDDIETVVIDDQSTDGLDRWLAEEIKRDPHLKSRPGPGEGVAAARNAGLALCSAPLIAFLDADDSWNENAIADRLRRTRRSSATAAPCRLKPKWDVARFFMSTCRRQTRWWGAPRTKPLARSSL